MNLEQITQKIKNEAGDTIVILARLQLSYEKRIAQLKKDMQKSKAGTKVRLDYLRALGKEERDHCELLMSLGYLPKNLGMQTVEKYEFQSRIGLGIGDNPAFFAYDPATFLEAEIVDPKQLKE